MGLNLSSGLFLSRYSTNTKTKLRGLSPQANYTKILNVLFTARVLHIPSIPS
jgi:hypothetical protein